MLTLLGVEKGDNEDFIVPAQEDAVTLDAGGHEVCRPNWSKNAPMKDPININYVDRTVGYLRTVHKDVHCFSTVR